MHGVCCHHLRLYFTEIPVNDIETISDDQDTYHAECSYPILRV